MTDADKKDKPKTESKKRQSKRGIVVLEETGAPDGVAGYSLVKDGFKSTSDARKWVRGEGEALKGKILIIASMTAPKKVTVETKAVTTF